MKKIHELTPEDIDNLSKEEIDELFGELFGDLTGEEIKADIKKYKGPPETEDEIKFKRLMMEAMERSKGRKKGG